MQEAEYSASAFDTEFRKCGCYRNSRMGLTKNKFFKVVNLRKGWNYFTGIDSLGLLKKDFVIW